MSTEELIYYGKLDVGALKNSKCGYSQDSEIDHPTGASYVVAGLEPSAI